MAWYESKAQWTVRGVISSPPLNLGAGDWFIFWLCSFLSCFLFAPLIQINCETGLEMWWCIIDGRLTRDFLTHTQFIHTDLPQEEMSCLFCRRAAIVDRGCGAGLDSVRAHAERILESGTFFSSCSLLILSLADHYYSAAPPPARSTLLIVSFWRRGIKLCCC